MQFDKYFFFGITRDYNSNTNSVCCYYFFKLAPVCLRVFILPVTKRLQSQIQRFYLFLVCCCWQRRTEHKGGTFSYKLHANLKGKNNAHKKGIIILWQLLIWISLRNAVRNRCVIWMFLSYLENYGLHFGVRLSSGYRNKINGSYFGWFQFQNEIIFEMILNNRYNTIERQQRKMDLHNTQYIWTIDHTH